MKVPAGWKTPAAVALGSALMLGTLALATPAPSPAGPQMDYGHPSAASLAVLPECKGPLAEQVSAALSGTTEPGILSSPEDAIAAGRSADEINEQRAKWASLSPAQRDFQACLNAAQDSIGAKAAADS